jgi:hypothetical protein
MWQRIALECNKTVLVWPCELKKRHLVDEPVDMILVPPDSIESYREYAQKLCFSISRIERVERLDTHLTSRLLRERFGDHDVQILLESLLFDKIVIDCTPFTIFSDTIDATMQLVKRMTFKQIHVWLDSPGFSTVGMSPELAQRIALILGVTAWHPLMTSSVMGAGTFHSLGRTSEMVEVELGHDERIQLLEARGSPTHAPCARSWDEIVLNLVQQPMTRIVSHAEVMITSAEMEGMEGRTFPACANCGSNSVEVMRGCRHCLCETCVPLVVNTTNCRKCQEQHVSKVQCISMIGERALSRARAAMRLSFCATWVVPGSAKQFAENMQIKMPYLALESDSDEAWVARSMESFVRESNRLLIVSESCVQCPNEFDVSNTWQKMGRNTVERLLRPAIGSCLVFLACSSLHYSSFHQWMEIIPLDVRVVTLVSQGLPFYDRRA